MLLTVIHVNAPSAAIDGTATMFAIGLRAQPVPVGEQALAQVAYGLNQGGTVHILTAPFCHITDYSLSFRAQRIGRYRATTLVMVATDSPILGMDMSAGSLAMPHTSRSWPVVQEILSQSHVAIEYFHILSSAWLFFTGLRRAIRSKAPERLLQIKQDLMNWKQLLDDLSDEEKRELEAQCPGELERVLERLDLDFNTTVNSTRLVIKTFRGDLLETTKRIREARIRALIQEGTASSTISTSPEGSDIEMRPVESHEPDVEAAADLEAEADAIRARLPPDRLGQGPIANAVANVEVVLATLFRYMRTT
ncbi:hypothetical protein NUW54_g6144 [Trametes sanguinea]|uniref:Uncharacterized protein n=1 Tax=Trametes sanguinea TaxID=158606 RepID=A0ACC1PTL6_9APHY|nr:hypothetical protein NUW54_g6144 [Trametes sanguinea]